jgi:uncharacterized UBP type Zn finger protein
VIIQIEKIQLTRLLIRLDNAEYPILETVAITYDPTPTEREQADKDLQDFARDLSKKLESAKKMHLEFEMARQTSEQVGGLINIGDTCNMASVMQMLAGLKPFIETLNGEEAKETFWWLFSRS